jgi:hypothetical protein
MYRSKNTQGILKNSIKALIKQIRINKLGKYLYNKKNKGLIIKFGILPADHLTRKLILNPVEDSRSAPS